MRPGWRVDDELSRPTVPPGRSIIVDCIDELLTEPSAIEENMIRRGAHSQMFGVVGVDPAGGCQNFPDV